VRGPDDIAPALHVVDDLARALLADVQPYGERADRHRLPGQSAEDEPVRAAQVDVPPPGQIGMHRLDELLVGRQSYFQRRAGVVTLTATTAAGRQSYSVTDLGEGQAQTLADELLPRLLDAFLYPPAAGSLTPRSSTAGSSTAGSSTAGSSTAATV
jgi:hypothetical protein